MDFLNKYKKYIHTHDHLFIHILTATLSSRQLFSSVYNIYKKDFFQISRSFRFIEITHSLYDV